MLQSIGSGLLSMMPHIGQTMQALPDYPVRRTHLGGLKSYVRWKQLIRRNHQEIPLQPTSRSLFVKKFASFSAVGITPGSLPLENRDNRYSWFRITLHRFQSPERLLSFGELGHTFFFVQSDYDEDNGGNQHQEYSKGDLDLYPVHNLLCSPLEITRQSFIVHIYKNLKSISLLSEAVFMQVIVVFECFGITTLWVSPDNPGWSLS